MRQKQNILAELIDAEYRFAKEYFDMSASDLGDLGDD